MIRLHFYSLSYSSQRKKYQEQTVKSMLLNKEASKHPEEEEGNKHVMAGCILKITSEPPVKIILSFSNCTVCKHWSDVRT